MTIKLEEKSIELNGRTYVLHINMSVLERLQEDAGGDINQLLKRNLFSAMSMIMAAMLNDWAEDQGWEEEWTEKRVKKTFSASMLNMLDVIGMFFRAMSPEKPENQKTENGEPGAEPGN